LVLRTGDERLREDELDRERERPDRRPSRLQIAGKFVVLSPNLA
jgi:hypothetical protein